MFEVPRELENAIERALIVGSGTSIEVEDLPQEVADSEPPEGRSDDLREILRRAEQKHIRRVLRESGENRTEAARRLGIDPSTLWRKLEGESK